jgi:CheY-like chemotaxis protein
VDDINTNLIVARGLMFPFGMQIEVCQSGQEAINMVQKNHYDMIFMDHMMPEMDGIEATSRIRALENEDGYYRNIPIIALTANAISGMKEMFIKHGMNDFLSKPIEISKLNAILDKWLPNEKKETNIPDNLPEFNIEELEKVEDKPFMIDGIDVKKGLSMTGGTLEYYIESLQSYVKDGQEKAVQIKEVLQKGDIALYTTYVHALKSASASIGAAEVSESAKKLEMAGKNQDMDYINANNDSFIGDLESTMANIATALKGREDKDAGAVDACSFEDLQKELPVLREALDAMDIQKSDQLIKQITAKKWEGDLAGTIQKIAQYVLFSDFDEAIGCIDELLKKTT